MADRAFACRVERRWKSGLCELRCLRWVENHKTMPDKVAIVLGASDCDSNAVGFSVLGIGADADAKTTGTGASHPGEISFDRDHRASSGDGVCRAAVA